MPGGMRNGVAGLSLSATFMKSRKIGAARCAAGRAAPEMARLVVADVDADREVGREADEPGVLLVVGGAGLAGDRLADRLRSQRRAVPRWTTPCIIEAI